MTKSITQSSSVTPAMELAKTSLVTALYIVVTTWLAVLSFGAVQIRISEMFNYLALYNKRYIVAVTLGVIISNFMSPTWVLDVPIGGISTFLVLLFCRFVTKHIKNDILKISITAIIFAASMFTVAFQLMVLFDVPFFYTWLTVGAGELLSMTAGGIVIYFLRKKIDFTR